MYANQRNGTLDQLTDDESIVVVTLAVCANSIVRRIETQGLTTRWGRP